jgi:hypothetical protein
MKRDDLKNKVANILNENPETRNCDIKLMICLWSKYFPVHIKTTISGQQGIFLSSLYTLPTQESIKRVRAIIQNDEHRFLPTDARTRKQRRIGEEEWRGWINQQTEYKRM